MANVAAVDLLAAAKLRFGEDALRSHLVSGDNAARDAELLKIAAAVLNTVQASCQAFIGWPIPGSWPAGSVSYVDGTTDISSHPYSEVWPADLWNHALGLINWRTYDGFDDVSKEVVTIGQSHEKYFLQLNQGAVSLGIAGDTDGGVAPKFVSSRDRFGRNLLKDGAPDAPYVSDSMCGAAWDRSVP